MGILLLALLFLVELAAVGAIGATVFQLTGGGYAGAIAAALAVALAVGAWGRLAAPKAVAPTAAKLGTKVVVFGGAVALLVAADHLGWALGLAALIVVAHVGAHLTGAQAAVAHLGAGDPPRTPR